MFALLIDLGLPAGENASDKSLEMMRKFSEQYCKGSDTYFCVDKSVTSVVIKGLAEHKDTLGAPLCPCRHYDDKAAEAKMGYWNCPCVPMRERKVRASRLLCYAAHGTRAMRAGLLNAWPALQECHCMLFLTEDNDFAGKDQTITTDEITEALA